jgi:long-chain fatty acid transport protein
MTGSTRPACHHQIEASRGSHKWPKQRLCGLSAMAVIAVLLPLNRSSATNGYYSNGYSIINDGMAGASIAYPQDTLALASNPAGLIDVGNRADLGIEYFRPDRGATT